MYLTRLIVVLVVVVAIPVAFAISMLHDRPRGYRFVARIVVVVAIVAGALFWATRPGIPGVLSWGYVRYRVGDAGTGAGLGDVVCEDLRGAAARRGPLRKIGYVGPIGGGMDPRAEVVEGGWFHGGAVYQPVSQIGQRDGLRDLLIDGDGCVVDAQTQI